MTDGSENADSSPRGQRPFGPGGGLHRLEACRALGEDTIKALFVQAKWRAERREEAGE